LHSFESLRFGRVAKAQLDKNACKHVMTPSTSLDMHKPQVQV
jgi:hypothetical protein